MSSNVAALDVSPVTRLLRALGDDTRLRIVALLSHGELCVCHIEAALDISQPNASRQMGILRTAGIVEPRREGNWIYHRLVRQPDEARRRVMATLIKTFAAQSTLKKDVERLLRMKGPTSCP